MDALLEVEGETKLFYVPPETTCDRKAAVGAPGWRSRLSVRLQPGHDLAVREFEPRVGLWAEGSEPGACFRFCVSLSLCPSPVHALSLSVPKIKIKNVEKQLLLLLPSRPLAVVREALHFQRKEEISCHLPSRLFSGWWYICAFTF